jgi:23S rRNA pseudouridine2605 synthase
MHPRYEFEREYAVRVMGTVSDQAVANLKNGVMLDDGMARFDSITRDPGGTGINHWYHVIIKEGRQREVRRLWETQGVQISRLIRVRYGSICLPRMLRPGRHEALTAKATKEFLVTSGFSDIYQKT